MVVEVIRGGGVGIGAVWRAGRCVCGGRPLRGRRPLCLSRVRRAAPRTPFRCSPMQSDETARAPDTANRAGHFLTRAARRAADAKEASDAHQARARRALRHHHSDGRREAKGDAAEAEHVAEPRSRLLPRRWVLGVGRGRWGHGRWGVCIGSGCCCVGCWGAGVLCGWCLLAERADRADAADSRGERDERRRCRLSGGEKEAKAAKEHRRRQRVERVVLGVVGRATEEV